jgi:MFS family permease
VTGSDEPAGGGDEPAATAGGLRVLAHYLGGFLGPFGTMVIVPMFPELRSHFSVDTATVSWGYSAYLFPMAALMVVSGTIGERYGRRLVLRLSLAAFALGAVVVSAAPSFEWFLAGRALQGTANAFFTPLLIAGLAHITPPERLGRRVGFYASFQAAGGGLAPFAGGLAADVDWRLAYWGSALAALVIFAAAPPGAARGATDRPPIRPLLSTRMLVFGIGIMAGSAGPQGAAVLVGLKTRDILDMDPTTAGMLLAGGNLGALALGPFFGRLVDRYGARTCGIVSGVLVSSAVATLGASDAVPTTAILWAVTGSLVGFASVVLQQAGVSLVPENRGGALSLILAFRFCGYAVGPLLWVPVFAQSVGLSFVGAASLGLITIAAFAYAAPGRLTTSGSGSESPPSGDGGVANTKKIMPAPASNASTVNPS